MVVFYYDIDGVSEDDEKDAFTLFVCHGMLKTCKRVYCSIADRASKPRA